ncbi:hypothetical protein EW027_05690 [Aeribacillus pallidus]|nr:hypothetical protein EW027_05690 [Aeribacillus pallidus]
MTAPKKHLFTNIAFCADCGTGMWYRQNRKGYICGDTVGMEAKNVVTMLLKKVTLNQLSFLT